MKRLIVALSILFITMHAPAMAQASGSYLAQGLIGSVPIPSSLTMTTPAGIARLNGAWLEPAASTYTYAPNAITWDYLQADTTITHVVSPTRPIGQAGLLIQEIFTAAYITGVIQESFPPDAEVPGVLLSTGLGVGTAKAPSTQPGLVLLSSGAGPGYLPSFGVAGPAGGGLGSSAVPTNGQIPIGNGSIYVPATLTAGTGIGITNAAGSITIFATGGGGGGTPGGTSGELQTNDGLGGFGALTGTGFIDLSSGAPTVRLLTGSDLPNPSATTLGGIESAAAVAHKWINSISTAGVPALSQPAFSDISGVATGAQLPNPSASTLGGIESAAPVSHEWIDSISTSGVPHLSQPAASDVSGLAASATTDTTDASNITTGTLSAGLLPATAVQANQSNTYTTGVQDMSAASVFRAPVLVSDPASSPGAIWIDGSYAKFWDNTSVTPVKHILLGSDQFSGGASVSTSGVVTLGNPGASTLGGIESYTAVSHQWINAISTAGVPASTQPGFSDLSGNINVNQMNSGAGASSSTYWRGDGTWATQAGGGTPGGTSGQIQTNSGSGGFGALTGTGAVSLSSGAPTVGTLGITDGGTGASSAGGNGLASGYAASGTNGDITSLIALTGAQTGMFSGGINTTTGNTLTLTATSASIQRTTTSSGGIAVTLPDATLCSGKIFWFMRQGASQLTFSTTNSQTINGASVPNYDIVDSGAGFFAVVSDGSNWQALIPSTPAFALNSGANGVMAWGGNYPKTVCASVAGQPLLSTTVTANSFPSFGATAYTTTSISTSQTLSSTSSKFILATGTITITLTPTANKEWIIYNNDTNTKTINTSSGSLLGTNGSSMTASGSARHYFSDGTNVICVGANGS